MGHTAETCEQQGKQQKAQADFFEHRGIPHYNFHDSVPPRVEDTPSDECENCSNWLCGHKHEKAARKRTNLWAPRKQARIAVPQSASRNRGARRVRDSPSKKASHINNLWHQQKV